MNIRQKIAETYPALNVYKSSWSGFFVVGFFSFFVNLGALVSPIYMQQIFDRVMQSRHIETLVFMTMIVIFMLAVIAVLDAIRGSVLAKIALWWDEVVNSDLLVAIIQVARSKGVSHAHAMSDLMTIRQFVGGPGVLPFFDGPWMPIFMLAIALIHPWLGIVAVVAAVLLFTLAWINDGVTRKKMAGIGGYQARAQTTIDIATRHADSVYSMGMLPGIVTRYKQDNNFVVHAMHDVAAFTAKIGAFSKFIRFSAQIAVLGLGAYLATLGEISAGSMIAASIIMGRALAPAEQALGAWRSFIGAMQAHQRIHAIFLDTPVDDTHTEQPDVRGDVEFKNVTFMIPGAERPVLRNIDLKIPPQNIVAIVGSSGSGKSTLCKMLIGALESSSGSVRMDGVAMQNWDKTQFAKNIGYLAQSVQLLDGTIAENIARMGEPDDKAVIEAAQLTGCHEMINQLPQGYDTVIGTHGQNLSGGQAQRIGFARAVYGRPKLIVLDEPNSNLDAEGDEAFHAGMIKMRELGSTLIIVSHKPAALANVNSIITIKEGMIAKIESREEFLKNAIRPVNALLSKLQKTKNAQHKGRVHPTKS